MTVGKNSEYLDLHVRADRQKLRSAHAEHKIGHDVTITMLIDAWEDEIAARGRSWAPRTFEGAYALADLRSDAGDCEVGEALGFCAASAERYRRWLRDLAWAAATSGGPRRRCLWQAVVLEMRAAGEDTVDLPPVPGDRTPQESLAEAAAVFGKEQE
jgi:hypothetical protein